MNKINFLIFFLTITFCAYNLVFAQNIDLKKIILDIEKGEVDKARIILMSLEKDNPNSPSVKFLKAVLSEDGNEASKLYREVAFSSDESEFKDDALFRLYQYYYSRGDFNESDKYARMLRESFPDSEFLNLIKRENNTSSRFETSLKFEQKHLSNTNQTNTQSDNLESNSSKNFTIQVGAFSTETNALKFASQFSGYESRIKEKFVNGKKLFIVLIGNFDSEASARNEALVIKNKFNIDGIVVKSE